jgi:hypothetical protein
MFLLAPAATYRMSLRLTMRRRCMERRESATSAATMCVDDRLTLDVSFHDVNDRFVETVTQS